MIAVIIRPIGVLCRTIFSAELVYFAAPTGVLCRTFFSSIVWASTEDLWLAGAIRGGRFSIRADSTKY